jgi:hypothetical protein
MEGIKNKSIIQPTKNKPRVKNQMAPDICLP